MKALMPATRVLLAAMLVAALAASAGAATIEYGLVYGSKLVLLDRYAFGRAKAVYVGERAANIEPGTAGDPPGLSGRVEIIRLNDPSNRAVYALPAANWLLNIGGGAHSLAKYVNDAAAPGGAGARLFLIRDSLPRLVTKNLGDGDGTSGDDGATDMDLQAITDTDTIRVVVTIDNAIDGNTYVFCSDFGDLTIKRDRSGIPFKVISKRSTAVSSCSDLTPPTTTTAPPPTTTSTTVTPTTTCPPTTAFYCGVLACGNDGFCPTGTACTTAEQGCECVGDTIPCEDLGGLSYYTCRWGACPSGMVCGSIQRQDACGYDCGCFACGSLGQLCCAGETCVTGMCLGGRCDYCGLLGGPCCPGDSCLSYPQDQCVNGTCTDCCSGHGGVCPGCSGGQTVCCDGTLSSRCGCP
jgi:hypothetical protein